MFASVPLLYALQILKHFAIWFIEKKQKEEAPPEAKSGSFVFPNGDKYGL
jgi:hypothetical protein